MAEEFDVEAMLEAPYKKEEPTRNGDRERDREKRHRSRSRERDRSDRDRDGDRKRSQKSEKKPSTTRDRDRDRGDRDRDRKKDRDRDGERKRDKDPERSSDRDRERDKGRDRGKDKHREKEPKKRSDTDKRRKRSRSMSPIRLRLRHSSPDMTPEERDARTVFCMQLSARIRPRDLEEFFSAVGKVKDVRIITDNKTRRSKGIAYIEFREVDSVAMALGLTGQRLLGVPIIVQVSQAEKNRQSAAAAGVQQKGAGGPMRLYVGSLHFNITEDMLRGIFEPFGKVSSIDEIKLIRNHETGRSQGYGFITFHNADDAKKALDQLNGFELAGRPMKVGHVTERTAENQGSSALDTDEMDRAGVDLGATGRLQLMAKLAEGTGFEIPQAAANALNLAPGQQQQMTAAPPIATQCFMLSNMFDPNTETSPTWDVEIQDDVIEECNKHGGVLHIYVDKASPQGNVYVKCPSIAAAVASVNALHGRYFAGKVITAAYVPLPNYHALFPDAQRSAQLVLSSAQRAAAAAGLTTVVPPPAPVPPPPAAAVLPGMPYV